MFQEDRNCLGKLEKYIKYGENVFYFTVKLGNTLHIGQLGTLCIDSPHIYMVPREPTARMFVQRIGFARSVGISRLLILIHLEHGSAMRAAKAAKHRLKI